MLDSNEQNLDSIRKIIGRIQKDFDGEQLKDYFLIMNVINTLTRFLETLIKSSESQADVSICDCLLLIQKLTNNIMPRTVLLARNIVHRLVPKLTIIAAFQNANMYRGEFERFYEVPMYFKKPGDFMSLIGSINPAKNCQVCKAMSKFRFCSEHAEFIQDPPHSLCHNIRLKTGVI